MTMNVTTEESLRYSITRDEENGTWRVLDTWHHVIRNALNGQGVLDLDAPPPEGSYKIINDGEFTALIAYAVQHEWLASDDVSRIRSQNVEKEREALREENEVLRARLADLQAELDAVIAQKAETPQPVQRTEAGLLKEEAMNNIVRLAGMYSMTE